MQRLEDGRRLLKGRLAASAVVQLQVDLSQAHQLGGVDLILGADNAGIEVERQRQVGYAASEISLTPIEVGEILQGRPAEEVVLAKGRLLDLQCPQQQRL